MQLRMMQEQVEYLKAQREAMAQQTIEINFRKGYEAGLSDGYENAKKTFFKDFTDYLPTLQTNIIRDSMKMVFTAQSREELETLVKQIEPMLAANPEDYTKKAMLILFKVRIAELTPPPPLPPPKKVKKAK